MKIGYMRVSTDEQDTALQRAALIRAGVDEENIYSDKISGKTINRVGLDACLTRLGKGDQLVVWKLDRLGRRAWAVLSQLEQLRERGVDFVSITEGFDTSTPIGKAMLAITAAFAELERDTNAERVKAGMAEARRQGRHLGRRATINAGEVLMRHRRGEPVRHIASMMGCGKSRVSDIIKGAHGTTA